MRGEEPCQPLGGFGRGGWPWWVVRRRAGCCAIGAVGQDAGAWRWGLGSRVTSTKHWRVESLSGTHLKEMSPPLLYRAGMGP